jgi:hypothetical protein
VRAEVYCYVSAQLLRLTAVALSAWLWLGKAGALVVGWNGRV